MKPLDRIFKALADPTRLRILNLLLKQPACVCELKSVLQLPQPLISRHLAYLRNAGLVADCRQGMRVQYAPIVEDGFGRALQELLLRAFQSQAFFCEDIERCGVNTELEARTIGPRETRSDTLSTGGQP